MALYQFHEYKTKIFFALTLNSVLAAVVDQSKRITLSAYSKFVVLCPEQICINSRGPLVDRKAISVIHIAYFNRIERSLEG